MNKFKSIAIVLLVCLLAVLFLSSFVWSDISIGLETNAAQDPILQAVSETAASGAAYSGESAASVPAEAKMDHFYARPWLEKPATAVSYSDALALRYAQQHGHGMAAPPERATRLDFMYAQQNGHWPNH